jgi:hypothetical protein
MSSDQRLTLILAFITVIALPSLAFSLRMMAKWTRVETKLEELIRNMEKLVLDKDRVHQTMQGEIRDDRAATDKRLRWLEEYLWRKGPPDG